MFHVPQCEDDAGVEGVKPKQSPKPPAISIRVWTVYRGLTCLDIGLGGWRHQVVEMCGHKRAIVRVHATFDHLGAAMAYERSLRAFFKAQQTFREQQI